MTRNVMRVNHDGIDLPDDRKHLRDLEQQRTVSPGRLRFSFKREEPVRWQQITDARMNATGRDKEYVVGFNEFPDPFQHVRTASIPN